jgi:hypothetical protein
MDVSGRYHDCVLRQRTCVHAFLRVYFVSGWPGWDGLDVLGGEKTASALTVYCILHLFFLSFVSYIPQSIYSTSSSRKACTGVGWYPCREAAGG